MQSVSRHYVPDERVDVWSLGCTVYAACAGGRSPFEYSMGQAGGSLALAVMSGRYNWPEAAIKRYPAEVWSHKVLYNLITRPVFRDTVPHPPPPPPSSPKP